MAKLTEKQKRFCDEYLICLNATQAAIRAGYSKKTARVIGAENLTKPYIQDFIATRLAEKENTLIATQDEVLKFLTAVLRGKEQDETIVDGEVIEVKRQASQMKAAELLAKYFGMLNW